MLFNLDLPTLNLVLEALAELPYKRVARTIEVITADARRQVAEAEMPVTVAQTPVRSPRRLRRRS